jgi:hypothetical protein
MDITVAFVLKLQIRNYCFITILFRNKVFNFKFDFSFPPILQNRNSFIFIPFSTYNSENLLVYLDFI